MAAPFGRVPIHERVERCPMIELNQVAQLVGDDVQAQFPCKFDQVRVERNTTRHRTTTPLGPHE